MLALMAAKGGTNMQIEWCTVRTPVMIAATGLAALLFSLQMRSAQRGIVERYASRWGVDRALAGRIYAPARFTLSRALLMFWALPVLLLLFSLIGLLAGLTPVFNACPALPFSRFMPVVMTGLVCLLPFSFGLMGLAAALTPRALAYSRHVVQIRRQDLPDVPTEADFGILLAHPPALPWHKRILAAIFAACGAAALAWLWMAHIPQDILADRPLPPFPPGLGEIATDAFRVFAIVMALAAAWSIWRIFTGTVSARRKIAVKWSVTYTQAAALLAPASSGVYRLLTIVCGGALTGGLATVPWMVVTQSESREIVLGQGAAFLLAMTALGLRMMFCPRTTLYLRTLSEELSQQSPDTGATAAEVAASIDRRAIAQGAWTLRLFGVVLIVMSPMLLLIALAPHRH